MKVRVHNDNVYPYKEKFKGKEVFIEAKGFIEMEKDDAYMFKGTFSPPVIGGSGEHKPEGFKMIRIEETWAEAPKEEETTTEFRCERDGQTFDSQAALDAHIEANYKDEIVTDEEAERELQMRKKTKTETTAQI